MNTKLFYCNAIWLSFQKVEWSSMMREGWISKYGLHTNHVLVVSDSFLRARTSTDHEATAMVKTQFMSFWDGLMTSKSSRIMIVGATNRPSDVDAAILRRMPSMFYVGYPVSRVELTLIICSSYWNLLHSGLNI